MHHNMEELIKQFLCCSSINLMNPMVSRITLDLDSQEKLLWGTVNSDLVKKYPIKHSYQISFLKWLMQKIEENGEEIHDQLYTSYCNLISVSSNESTHYRHFVIEDGSLDRIVLRESTKLISEGTTGLCSWQAAVGLSQWCLENKTEFSGKSILELGCGVGLTGLQVVSSCSPKKYIFSDCHPAVLAMACENVKLNLLRDAQSKSQLANERLKLDIKYNDTFVKVMELRWEDIENCITKGFEVPEVIIGADILYETNSFRALVSGLKAFLSLDTKCAIIAATVRNADTISQFLDELDHHNLTFEECAQSKQVFNTLSTNSVIRILKIFLKR